MKLPHDEFDLIVVGGGPGGAAAALVGARRGLRVLLIDKRQEIGTPVRCAEAIGYELINDYIEVDERWVSAWIDAFRIVGPSGQSVRVPPTSPTMVVDRKIFDRELVAQAIRAGAIVRAMTCATGLILEDGAVRGVKMISLGQEVTVRAKVVIGADGPESSVGRWAGLNVTPRSTNTTPGCSTCWPAFIWTIRASASTTSATSLRRGGTAGSFPRGRTGPTSGL
jgi:digeranylgeranylglycerophospholipid reductase